MSDTAYKGEMVPLILLYLWRPEGAFEPYNAYKSFLQQRMQECQSHLCVVNDKA